jgi:predicted signal transduction protein with EAL and GGDEF domain
MSWRPAHGPAGVRRCPQGTALDERRLLAGELRQALVHRGLVLHYQPLYGADGATLCGYEALARWPHPRHGFVPPSLPHLGSISLCAWIP